MKDYYSILGLEKGASSEEIRKAYKTLAQKYHPDKKDGDEAKYLEIQEAYNILIDPERRARYDSGEEVHEDRMTPERQAKTFIYNVFDSLLSNPDEFKIEKARQDLIDMRDTMETLKEKAEKTKLKYEALFGRVKSDDPQNGLSQLIKNKIDTLTGQIFKFDFSKQAADIAVELLSQYELEEILEIPAEVKESDPIENSIPF